MFTVVDDWYCHTWKAFINPHQCQVYDTQAPHLFGFFFASLFCRRCRRCHQTWNWSLKIVDPLLNRKRNEWTNGIYVICMFRFTDTNMPDSTIRLLLLWVYFLHTLTHYFFCRAAAAFRFFFYSIFKFKRILFSCQHRCMAIAIVRIMCIVIKYKYEALRHTRDATHQIKCFEEFLKCVYAKNDAIKKKHIWTRFMAILFRFFFYGFLICILTKTTSSLLVNSLCVIPN